MLVLTRKVGDVIAIGDNIKIVVMAIKGKQVRLGVQADRSTVVHREEIYQKIQQEIKAALQTDLSSTTAAGDLLKSATDAQTSPPSSPLRRESRPNGTPLVRKTNTNALAHEDSQADDTHSGETETLTSPGQAPRGKPSKG